MLTPKDYEANCHLTNPLYDDIIEDKEQDEEYYQKEWKYNIVSRNKITKNVKN